MVLAAAGLMEKAGQINAYECTVCGRRTVTVNRDDGVTPFIIMCRQGFPDTCGEEARSLCYNVPQNLLPSHEWFRPDEKMVETMEKRGDTAAVEHVRNGGLHLRRLDPLQLEGYGFRMRHG